MVLLILIYNFLPFKLPFIHMAKIYAIIHFRRKVFIFATLNTVAMRYCIAVSSAWSSSPGIFAFSHEIPMEQSRIGPLVCYALLPVRFSISHYIMIRIICISFFSFSIQFGENGSNIFISCTTLCSLIASMFMILYEYNWIMSGNNIQFKCFTTPTRADV